MTDVPAARAEICPAIDVARPAIVALCEDVRLAAVRVMESAPPARRPAPVAATPADPEAIHDLRVGIRRLRVLLRAVSPLFRRAPLRAAIDAIREVAGAAGAVRDEEVLVETLTETIAAMDPGSEATLQLGTEVNMYLARRRAGERRLRRGVARALHEAKPRRTAIPPEAELGAPPASAAATSAAAPLRGLLATLRDIDALPLRRRRSAMSAAMLAERAIAEAARAVKKRASKGPLDVQALHDLRIAWKRLRYTIEGTAEWLPEAGRAERDRAGKAATRMQKRLGHLHDFDEAILRVGRVRRMDPQRKLTLLQQLLARRDVHARALPAELTAALAALDGLRGLRRD